MPPVSTSYKSLLRQMDTYTGEATLSFSLLPAFSVGQLLKERICSREANSSLQEKIPFFFFKVFMSRKIVKDSILKMDFNAKETH